MHLEIMPMRVVRLNQNVKDVAWKTQNDKLKGELRGTAELSDNSQRV